MRLPRPRVKKSKNRVRIRRMRLAPDAANNDMCQRVGEPRGGTQAPKGFPPQEGKEQEDAHQEEDSDDGSHGGGGGGARGAGGQRPGLGPNDLGSDPVR